MQRNLTWVPFFVFLKKEIRRFTRVFGQTLITPIISSTLYLFIFGVSLGFRIEVLEGEVSYLSFLIPGLLMMGVLNNAFQNITSSVSIAKFHGEFECVKMTPLSPTQFIWGMSIAGLIRGALVGGIIFIVGSFFSLVNLGSLIPIEHFFTSLLFILLGGLSFSFLGIIISFKAQNYEQVNAVGTFILIPLMYLGGVFFSLEDLHMFWQTLSKFNPLLYFVNGMRYGILGVSDISWQTCTLVGVITPSFLYIVAYFSVLRGSFQRW